MTRTNPAQSSDRVTRNWVQEEVAWLSRVSACLLTLREGAALSAWVRQPRFFVLASFPFQIAVQIHLLCTSVGSQLGDMKCCRNGKSMTMWHFHKLCGLPARPSKPLVLFMDYSFKLFHTSHINIYIWKGALPVILLKSWFPFIKYTQWAENAWFLLSLGSSGSNTLLAFLNRKCDRWREKGYNFVWIYDSQNE